MADDSDGEGFYDDPFEFVSDGEDFRDDEEYDDGCPGLCGGPSDEEGDDDSNGEEIREVPCCYDDDDDGSDSEDLPRDDDDYDGESEEALSEDDADAQDEEVCDEEGNGGELVDDPSDEDGEEGDGGESQDLCEDPSSNDDEEGDGTDIPDSVEDDYSSEEVEVEEITPVALPLPWAIRNPMVIDSDGTGTDSSDSGEDGYSSSEMDDEMVTVPVALPLPWARAARLPMVIDSDDDSDYDSNDTDYDDYEVHRLPASRAAVESLQEVALSKEDAACGCAVCKEVFESGHRVVSLPCKHYFHDDCIQPWLAIRSTCPVCRYQLPTDDAESRQGQADQLRVLQPVAPHSETQQVGAEMEAMAGEPPQAQGTRATECLAGSGHEQSSP